MQICRAWHYIIVQNIVLLHYVMSYILLCLSSLVLSYMRVRLSSLLSSLILYYLVFGVTILFTTIVILCYSVYRYNVFVWVDFSSYFILFQIICYYIVQVSRLHIFIIKLH